MIRPQHDLDQTPQSHGSRFPPSCLLAVFSPQRLLIPLGLDNMTSGVTTRGITEVLVPAAYYLSSLAKDIFNCTFSLFVLRQITVGCDWEQETQKSAKWTDLCSKCYYFLKAVNKIKIGLKRKVWNCTTSKAGKRKRKQAFYFKDQSSNCNFSPAVI